METINYIHYNKNINLKEDNNIDLQDENNFNIINNKIRILKNGQIIIYSYDQKIYNDSHYNKYKNEPMKKIKCNCGGITDKYNYSTHNKSIKHKKYLSSLNIDNNENLTL